jgi:hypothetical protein
MSQAEEVVTSENTVSAELDTIWADDRLCRRGIADFLTKFSQRKHTETGHGLTLAIDADWGQGKSFFVDRWRRQLESTGCICLHFDAWKNDISGSPVEAFLGMLFSEVKNIEKKRSKVDAIATSIQDAKKITARALRKAIYPTMKLVAMQGFKKVVGVGLEEYKEYISNDTDGETVSDDKADSSSSLAKQGIALGEEALDNYFENAVGALGERLNHLEQFRSSLTKLVESLNNAQDSNNPIYIFVDELDRCKPTFSIELLEGIKHIFSVSGVVFVLSINTEQLANSICAVYGEKFNGHMYLKRFADYQLTLPTPKFDDYIDELVGKRFDNLQTVTGIELRANPTYTKNGALKLLCDACQIDARTLRSVILRADAIVSVLPVGQKIAISWLYFLIIANHLSPVEFKALKAGKSELQDTTKLRQLLKSILKNESVEIFYRNPMQSNQGAGYVLTSHALIDLILFYCNMARTPVKSLKESYYRIQAPASLEQYVLIELIEQWVLNDSTVRHPIADYYGLVETAGYFQ